MRRIAGSGAGAAKPKIGVPIAMSGAIHGSLVALVLLAARPDRTPLPPVYRVQLVAAPPGERAIGVVTDAPAPAAPAPLPPKRAESIPKVTPPARRPPARKATPNATVVPDARATKKTEAAPKAGGGPKGGQGADVANVNLEGIEFPYPAYLRNIVTQIAARFKPRNAGVLSTEIVFLIRRDGSVSEIRLRKRSGSLAYDVEAQGAIEAAASARAFGPLPSDWADDVLPVIFTFDSKLIR
jgi:outer membrane biosynthesis protein TonB